VVRYLTPVASEDRVFNSGSERFSPGVVCMSDHCFTWPVAEMLVHEASHQYMNLVTLADPLVNGERMYFSPFRQKDRPLFFILAAYHSFGNVLAFYRTARAKGFTPDEDGLPEGFIRREQTLRRQLSSLAEVLLASRGLTEAGEALWRPIFDDLRGD
jgi:HEXXH motif-containing protein